MTNEQITKALQDNTHILKIEEMATSKRWFIYVKPLKENTEFLIELSFCFQDNKNKNSITNIWFKNGFTKKLLNSYIIISTYYTDENGNCYGRYNPTHTKNHKIDFNYMLEVTEENIKYLINETIKKYHKESK